MNPRILIPALVVLATALVRVHAQTEPGTHPAIATDPAATAPRFVAYDIRIDPRGRALAAYQIEVTDAAGAATIVGVEGGEHRAFAEPPYYDPQALAGGRILLAALNTGDDLPTTATRVARIHVRIAANQSPQFRIELTAAAGPDESPVAADVTIEEIK